MQIYVKDTSVTYRVGAKPRSPKSFIENEDRGRYIYVLNGVLVSQNLFPHIDTDTTVSVIRVLTRYASPRLMIGINAYENIG